MALDLEDYDRETGALTIRSGKGHKERVAYATNGAADALAAWVTRRGDEPGALLCPVDKSGRVTVRRLTGKAVTLRLQRRAGQANVAAFSPHDLRRTFIGDLLDRGADIATVQGLAGGEE